MKKKPKSCPDTILSSDLARILSDGSRSQLGRCEISKIGPSLNNLNIGYISLQNKPL